MQNQPHIQNQHRYGKTNLHKPNQNQRNRGTTPQEHVAYWPQFSQLPALSLSSQ